MKKSLFILLFASIVLSSCSQDADNVKRVVLELTKDDYYGRGAAFDGERKAAKYIKSQFKEVGLEPISGNYFQNFTHKANVFADICEVKVDGCLLQPGVDFTVSNNSKSIDEEYSLLYISNDDLMSKEPLKRLSSMDLHRTVLVVDEDYVNNNFLSLNFSRNLINSLSTAGRIRLHAQQPTYFGIAFRYLSSKVNIIANKSRFPSDAKKISIKYESTYVDEYPSMNVIGKVEGESVPDSFIVICGHYDHLGMMGKKTMFPGADDNASAIGVILDLAKQYSSNRIKSKYSLVFIAFGGEESGLVGSRYFVENPLVPLTKIKIVLDLDMVGFGKDGLNIWNCIEYADVRENFDDINYKGKYFPSIKYKGEIAESDHHPFYLSGVKAIFITTGTEQSPYFHTKDDTYSNVTFDKIVELENLLIDYIPKVN